MKEKPWADYTTVSDTPYATATGQSSPASLANMMDREKTMNVDEVIDARPRSRLHVIDEARPAAPLAPLAKQIWAKAPMAKRYVFDDEASTRLGEFLREEFDLVWQMMHLLRPPYPVTYVEVSTRHMFKAWKPGQQMSVETMDTECGYLIDGVSCLSVARTASIKSPFDVPMPAGWFWQMNTPQAVPFEKYLAGEHLDNPIAYKEGFILGGYRFKEKGTKQVILIKPQVPKGFSTEAIVGMFNVLPTYGYFPNNDAYSHALLGGAGDPMIVAAALLLLSSNRTVVQMDAIPHSKGIVRGKRVVFKPHTKVTIHLNARKVIRRESRQAIRAHMRLHDVQGHWRHVRILDGCKPGWKPYSIDGETICDCCMGKLKWVPSFERGDASLGRVDKHYEVKL